MLCREIRPIAELRNTSKISKICHDTKEPVFITQNGYGDLVIMSMETYENRLELAGVYRKFVPVVVIMRILYGARRYENLL